MEAYLNITVNILIRKKKNFSNLVDLQHISENTVITYVAGLREININVLQNAEQNSVVLFHNKV